MSAELLREFLEVQAHFGLPSPALVEKDFHVVRALSAASAADLGPFALVFGGGTAMVRAHRLIERMSEDVDLKVVPRDPALGGLGQGGRRKHLGELRDRLTAALQAAGFALDAADPAHVRSRNANHYTIYRLPYDAQTEAQEVLRPAIQLELTYAPLRLPSVTLPVTSFVAEAFGRPPEVAGIACVSVTETAAEKLVSLTRRTAMELAGHSRDADPALVRHIYDLHMIRAQIDAEAAGRLAAEIARADAEAFANQYPAYRDDIAGETRKALDAIRTAPLFRERYERFLAAMVYGERPGFEEAVGTVGELVKGMEV
ncbi:nucleotidyl transferase AbiEii/AbiGii toxin family protein [Nitrospirillum bahiense]|uniref:Nucleotidyltransferase AbiEii toxin of type IV toxin-antitoxin system n=1 Tax=Nitrospirillum amazonense TaxID=28077 RepID=A0A560FHQ0_9PROT|nr:nucleotidyl transferase AbiEii/AbiGii toxin family protein [Nitrospirillum amazonense]TWB21127.1 nucleotidyltransferase AbiEii toxin of type IV toxin-antitoxin system [Nitrospirillum amazonense]